MKVSAAAFSRLTFAAFDREATGNASAHVLPEQWLNDKWQARPCYSQLSQEHGEDCDGACLLDFCHAKLWEQLFSASAEPRSSVVTLRSQVVVYSLFHRQLGVQARSVNGSDMVEWLQLDLLRIINPERDMKLSRCRSLARRFGFHWFRLVFIPNAHQISCCRSKPKEKS